MDSAIRFKSCSETLVMSRTSDLRHQIALQAARILAEQRYLSYDEARSKAARHLGADNNRRNLPDNQEIELALKEYQAIFQSDRQPNALRKLRQQAVNAMQMLERFQPRLTGDVLSGTADEQSPVQLFLFCDSAEEVIFFLLDQKIPWKESEVVLHYPKGRTLKHPCFSFRAGDIAIELIVLAYNAIKNPPLSSLHGRPDKGASLANLQNLLEESDQRLENGT